MLRCLLIIILLYPTVCFAGDAIERLARLPNYSQLQISPNGNNIGYLQTIDDKFYIVTSQLGGKTKNKPTVFGLGNAKIRYFRWLSEDRIFFHASFTKYSKGDQERFTFLRAGILDIKENSAIWPFSSQRFLFNLNAPRLANTLPNEPDHVLMSNYYGSIGAGMVAKLYKVNIRNGDREEYFYKSKNNNWITNEVGEIKLLRKYDPKAEESYWHIKTNDDYALLTQLESGTPEGFKHSHLAHFDEESQELYYFQDNDAGFQLLYKSKISNFIVGPAEPIFEDKRYDVSGGVYDYHTSKLIGIEYTADFDKTKYLYDRQLAQVQADLEATFPMNSVHITSYTSDRNKFIAKVTGPNSPDEYFFYDQQAGRLDLIISGYTINRGALGKTELFSYKTEDELTIDGYFTKPANHRGELPPLVVLPHGGPELRDTLNFDWLRATLSASGYAVYQPNFRGSSGYGTEFAEAGYGEWGEKMQRDIDDGVSALISQSKIDKNRVCILGASYGGYAAMIAATKLPQRYKCAISFGGVSDLDDLFYHDIEQLGNNSYWEKSIGERRDQAALAKNSPRNLVSEKTSPILLLHGDKDTVVPTFQSKNMYKALKEFNVEGSKYIELEDADHWFSSTKARAKFAQEAINFLENYL